MWTIRNDVRFSDGKKMDADDVIFSYYVFADPTYTGSTTLYSVNIDGLRNYRTQTSDEVYEKYSDMADVIYAAGPDQLELVRQLDQGAAGQLLGHPEAGVDRTTCRRSSTM